MNQRSSSDYEFNEQIGSWVKETPYETRPVSPQRSKMIANTSNTNELHRIPTAMTVSATGERMTCALDSLETSLDATNPFFDSLAHDSKLNYNFLTKSSSKHEKFRHQNRRKPQGKDRRIADKIILKQKPLMTARRQPKCAAVQTDTSMNLSNSPETIGDGRRLSRSCMDLTSSTIMETIDSDNLTNNYYLYLTENQRKCLSFLLMVILVFCLTSIILDVDISAEVFRIASNYIWSLNLGFLYQEKPLTFTEKFWKYITCIFE